MATTSTFAKEVAERVLTFKPHQELPAAFKHLPNNIPVGLTNVLVLAQDAKGSEVYLTVRYKAADGSMQQSVLSRRHFFNKGQLLIYQKRNRKARLN